MFVWEDKELNDEQIQAVLEPNNVFLTACPGSGKTRALTYKIAYELSLLESTKEFVVAITYTNRAADEIHERIELMGVNTNQLWIGTIHSFCLKWIIRPYVIYSEDLSHGYRVINSYDSENLFNELCKPYRSEKISSWDCGYTFTSMGYTLNCNVPSKQKSLHKILNEYFECLLKNKQIDFELILYYSHELISNNKSIAKLLGKMFKYILVDEYQDTKEIQYSILANIIRNSEKTTKSFIVGDPNQAIYTSLGGYPISIDELSTMCDITFTSLKLEKNYRSSEKIINYFNNYNVHNTSIKAFSHHKNFSSKISFNNTVHVDDVVDEIVRLVKISIEIENISPNNICILAPWWIHLVSMTRILVTRLPEYNFDGPGLIPFSRDIDNFWYKLSKIALTTASPEIYVRRVRWANDIISELLSAGIIVKGLTYRKLLRLSNSITINENDGLKYLSQFFSEFFKEINLDFTTIPVLAEHYDAFFKSSESRIQRLIKDGVNYIGDISNFRKVFQQRTGITVSTIHGVKGAEYDTVIACALLDGMVPHFSDPDKTDSSKKLLYVISSRARKHLHLISEVGRSFDKPPTPVLADYNYHYDIV